MNPKPEQYVNTRRDSVRENDLCKYLRLIDEEEATDFVLRLLELDPSWGLPVARRVLRRPKSVESVLKLGIQLADASTMKYWLRACLPKLGVRKTVQVLERHIKSDPAAVEDALYWIPRVQSLTAEDMPQIEQLADKLKAD